MQTNHDHLKRPILVLSNNDLTRKITCDFLEALGYSVLGSRYPYEAIRAAAKHRPHKILIADHQLSEVCEAVRHLKRYLEDIWIITIMHNDKDKEIALESGCDRVLVLPLNRNELISELD